jgi:import inner membrane translocase subunit TIM21
LAFQQLVSREIRGSARVGHCLARHANMSSASRLARLFRGQTRIALVATRTASTSAWSSPAMLQACRAMPPLVGTPPRVLPRAHRGLAAAGLAGSAPAAAARGVSCTSAASAARREGGRSPTPVESSSSVVKPSRGEGGRYDEITDKWIPEKPVSAAEAGGYGVFIAAGLAVALGAVWFSLKELVLEPAQTTVFKLAVRAAENDPRVTVRVGTPMTSYGGEGRSRSRRASLAHATETDARGRLHVRVQGAVRGSSGKGTVHCDAVKDERTGEWRFEYLVVDVGRDRIVVVQPRESASRAIMREPEKVYAVGD